MSRRTSILDVAGVADLSLTGHFQKFLSVRHMDQLVTHGENVGIARSVSCKLIALKSSFSHYVLIFVDKFYFSIGSPKWELWKIFVRKSWCKVAVMEIVVWKFSNIKNELIPSCFSWILATDNGTNIVQSMCLTEQSLLSKTTTGRLWNFSFMELWVCLTSNFTCNDTIFKRIL